ncbi:MAG: hypothetical protein PHW72_01710, partial [Candidatus Pacebacteria bacterium]|nr:hypothetical protein [Candidatus Paceibacterota bacterium]
MNNKNQENCHQKVATQSIPNIILVADPLFFRKIKNPNIKNANALNNGGIEDEDIMGLCSYRDSGSEKSSGD